MIQRKNYNYGIDLLRIVSMMFIITLHIFNHGNVLKSDLNSLQYTISWAIFIFCNCGVNCFALISGFVSYKDEYRQPKYSRYIELWFQVTFYSIIITLIFFILKNYDVSYSRLIKSFLPLTFNSYWYFSAYTGLFIMLPFLDFIVRNMDKSNLKKALIICLIAFSLYAPFGSRYSDPFKLSFGYSMSWLSFMYILGAYIKKYNIHNIIENKKAIFLIATCFIFNLIWFLFIGKIIGHGVDGIFNSYISITTLGIAIGLLLVFGKMNIKGNFKNLITVVSPTVFGIYLIHDHSLVEQFVMNKIFAFIPNLNAILIPIAVILSMLGIFLFGFLIEKIRILIFKILSIRKFSELLESKLYYILNKFA